MKLFYGYFCIFEIVLKMIRKYYDLICCLGIRDLYFGVIVVLSLIIRLVYVVKR